MSDGKKYTVVTPACKCFTGQYLSNFKIGYTTVETTVRHDNAVLRYGWFPGPNSCNDGKCGSCAHLGFKDGIGYCEKS